MRFGYRVCPLLTCIAVCDAADLGYAGSRACAPCHQAIHDSYHKTAMARTSGVADKLETFTHASFRARGFLYNVARERSGLRFNFTNAGGSLRGAKSLPYFVGSGAAARSYLIAEDGYLFESPVAYYAEGRRWDLAPGYETYVYPQLTRPALPGCMNCHASFLASENGAGNRYGQPPFGEAGVACERCHGPGAAHAAGRGSIVNPAKLDAERRDSVCSQCHLSGEVRVRAAGADWNTFQSGAKLSDTVTVFVRADRDQAMTVTGHVEKLAESACKQASGDRFWCGTCHDPHASPSGPKRVTAIRARCLNCHKPLDCVRGPDCAGCHMPKNPVKDAQHVVYTDHSIPRRPRSPLPAKPRGELVRFDGAPSSIRDLALAYAIAGYRDRALPLLERAIAESPNDVEGLMHLAEIHRNGGRGDEAIPLFQRAIRLDPGQLTASVGLGGIMMERSNFGEAIRLWEDALAKNAGLVLVRTNLAMAYLRIGDKQAAERHLLRTLELSPAFEPAANLLKAIRQQ